MSSLWTPGGEHHVPREPADSSDEPPPAGAAEGEIDPEAAQAMAEQMAEAQQRILAEPIDVMVTNHVMGLYELAAIHLSADPPNLAEARLPIDAMGLLVDNLADRLAEPATLQSALQQLRVAYVDLARRADEEAGEGPGDDDQA